MPLCRTPAFAAVVLSAALARGAEPVQVHVDLTPVELTVAIPEDFVGFGYETSAAAQPGYFSAGNDRLVHLYRNVAAHGLIRIGGNVSDHTRYEPDGTVAVHHQRETTVINRAGLTDLGGFARATGWQVMWGVNLGTGSKEEAAIEATDVARALGDRLHSFEIGNEVDALPRFHGNYGQYHGAFLDYRAAIRAALPAAQFSGPDVIGSWSFLTGFATDESADGRLLTQHYYRSDMHKPDATLDNLLRPDGRLATRLDALRDLCAAHHLPGYRINETNSFSGGGKPGISDTFAGALWALDYLYVLAAHGCAGVNLETDVNHLAWISHYSPIVHDPNGVCTARPEYYGLLAFAMAGHGHLLRAQPATTDVNVAAYVTRDDHGVLWVTVINKDQSADAVVTLDGVTSAEAYWLRAPAVDAKDGVTFAGTTVADDGSWKPGEAERLEASDGAAHLLIPHARAVVVRAARK